MQDLEVLSGKGEHRNNTQCSRGTALDHEHKLTCCWGFGMPGFSDFGLIFSLGFGFASLPELKIFMVAAACLRMQSLLQYTESGWATLKQPGPMHLAAPGASITFKHGEKWREIRLQRGNSRNSLCNVEKRLHSSCADCSSDLHNCQAENNSSWHNTNNPYKDKNFTSVTLLLQDGLPFQVIGLLALR